MQIEVGEIALLMLGAEFVFLDSHYRFVDHNVIVKLFGTGSELPGALHNWGLNEYLNGGAPGPGVLAGGPVNLAAMPRVTKASLRRALVLLSNALPDVQGVSSAICYALSRKVAVDFIDPLEFSDGVGASPIPCCCIAPHLVQGQMVLPQSSTASSMTQAMAPLGEERAKTKAAVELFCQMVEGDNFGQTLPSAMLWAQMLASGVCQGLRYIGISPAVMWDQGPWPFPGCEDERPFLGYVCRGDACSVTPLADLTATAMARMFNVELPASFVAGLHWRNASARGPGQRPNEHGTAPWVARHWTFTPEAVSPHSLPAEIVTTLRLFGMSR